MPSPPGGWWFSTRGVFATRSSPRDIQQYLEIFFKVFFLVIGTIFKSLFVTLLLLVYALVFLAPRHGGS